MRTTVALLFSSIAALGGDCETGLQQLRIEFAGMMRSGNHPVILSLAAAIQKEAPDPSKPILHLNNCAFSAGCATFWNGKTSQSPTAREPRIASRAVYVIDKGKVIEERESVPLAEADVNRVDAISEGDARTFRALPKAKFDTAIVSLEDLPADKFGEVPWSASSVGPARRTLSVYVIRDPYNWLASRLKAKMDVGPETIARWKTAARMALGKTANPHGIVFINYNSWFASADYRAQIGKRLGLKGPLELTDDVPKNGGGSSFDGQKLDGQGTRMDVGGRWQSLKDDPEFKRLAADPELAELSQALFGFRPQSIELSSRKP